MNPIEKLHQDVITARKNYINLVKGFSYEQGAFKPATEVWSASEITEHLFHAEFGGIWAMWKALEGNQNGNPTWKEAHHNKGLTIEEVVDKTWKTKEQAPQSAVPRLGGPINFWISTLESCQTQLNKLTASLKDFDLETIIYPHPISGPLDARQRYEFLRFHIDRHRTQVEKLLQHPDFHHY